MSDTTTFVAKTRPQKQKGVNTMYTNYDHNYYAERDEAIQQLHSLLDILAETDITLAELDALILDITEIITR